MKPCKECGTIRPIRKGENKDEYAMKTYCGTECMKISRKKNDSMFIKRKVSDEEPDRSNWI